MAEQSPAVSVSHPPEKLLRAVNPVLKFLLGTPLAGPARKDLMVLSFKGCKSGNPYSIPVSAHNIGGQLYALAGAPWTRNFRGGADTEVLHDGKKTSMRGELIEDAAGGRGDAGRPGGGGASGPGCRVLWRQARTALDGAGFPRPTHPHGRRVQG